MPGSKYDSFGLVRDAVDSNSDDAGSFDGDSFDDGGRIDERTSSVNVEAMLGSQDRASEAALAQLVKSFADGFRSLTAPPPSPVDTGKQSATGLPVFVEGDTTSEVLKIVAAVRPAAQRFRPVPKDDGADLRGGVRRVDSASTVTTCGDSPGPSIAGSGAAWGRDSATASVCGDGGPLVTMMGPVTVPPVKFTSCPDAGFSVATVHAHRALQRRRARLRGRGQRSVERSSPLGGGSAIPVPVVSVASGYDADIEAGNSAGKRPCLMRGGAEQ